VGHHGIIPRHPHVIVDVARVAEPLWLHFVPLELVFQAGGEIVRRSERCVKRCRHELQKSLAHSFSDLLGTNTLHFDALPWHGVQARDTVPDLEAKSFASLQNTSLNAQRPVHLRMGQSRIAQVP